MRKITAIILVFFMTINISFAFQGDILYVKNNNSELKKSANDSSETLAKLMKGYVVMDDGLIDGEYKKIKLTDGKVGYMLNKNIGNQNNISFEVSGNSGTMKSMTLLRMKPLPNSNPIGVLFKGVKFGLLVPNYINNDWIRIKVLDGKNKQKVGYIRKNAVNFECSSNVANLVFSELNIDGSNIIIPGINVSSKQNYIDNQFCLLADNINLLDSNIELNSADDTDDDTGNDDGRDDFINAIGDMIDDIGDDSGTDDSGTEDSGTEDSGTDDNGTDDDFFKSLGDIFNDIDSGGSSDSGTGVDPFGNSTDSGGSSDSGTSTDPFGDNNSSGSSDSNSISDEDEFIDKLGEIFGDF